LIHKEKFITKELISALDDDPNFSTFIDEYIQADVQADVANTISVTDTGGDGSLSYDNSTGVITYTGPSASEVRAHFSAGSAVSIANGVIAVDSTKINNWDEAYSWGDHADEGYLTSFTETDPTVPAHVKSITTTEKTNWNTAYGWGDHADEGYLTSLSLDEISDVALTGTSTGDILKYNGAQWVNDTIDYNVDGGSASAVYLASQSLNGGNA
jgi:hypothetical protein